MRLTAKDLRPAVAAWLKEENATAERALQLLDALYAGAIEGTSYSGTRVALEDGDAAPYHALNMSKLRENRLFEDEDTSDGECGCLLETLERMRLADGDARPRGWQGVNTSKAFWFAVKIRQGDTPFNSAYAKAAAQGIEDYLADFPKEAVLAAV